MGMSNVYKNLKSVPSKYLLGLSLMMFPIDELTSTNNGYLRSEMDTQHLHIWSLDGRAMS